MSRGVVAWVVAVVFGCFPTAELCGPVVPPAGSNTSAAQDYEAVSATAAAAGGFAIAGGLCFLASRSVDPR